MENARCAVRRVVVCCILHDLFCITTEPPWCGETKKAAANSAAKKIMTPPDGLSNIYGMAAATIWIVSIKNAQANMLSKDRCSSVWCTIIFFALAKIVLIIEPCKPSGVFLRGVIKKKSEPTGTLLYHISERIILLSYPSHVDSAATQRQPPSLWPPSSLLLPPSRAHWMPAMRKSR